MERGRGRRTAVPRGGITDEQTTSTTRGQATPPDESVVPVEQVLSQVCSAPEGLSTEQARDRLERDGPNEVVERRRNPVLVFLGYFWAPIPWMIEVALVLSVLVQHWTDAAIIGVLLAMNGVVAFAEEHQAANAIDALKKRLSSTARALRDGIWVDVPARELVAGDVIRLRLGDVVPADARILTDVELQVDQSALTGESMPVTRGRGGPLYSGSVVLRGEADAVVYATGAGSFYGRTTGLVALAGTVSHFQRAVIRIGNYLIVLALALVAVTVAVSLLRGNAVLGTLEFALVVTIASVPVALPAVLSVTMAVGARELARQQAVVSHLPAVEELGGIDVLCSDKTGTLTQNRLRVGDPWCAPGTTREELLAAAALASRAEDRDPIDGAVLAAAGEPPSGATVIAYLPFDPVSKRTEATVRTDGGTYRASKGAPQVMAALCQGDPVVAAAEDVVQRHASRGFRSLSVARAQEDGPWRLLGVLPLSDPPREDSAATIQAAQALGVEVKMVTGDQAPIGAEVARQVGLGDQILDAALLDGVGAGEGGQDEADLIEDADGFAQVFPEHKYRIVQVLQQRQHIVGMTGDGVNDAPALKQADAGIAVAGATEAARAAADVVLLSPGLSVIVSAIRLSREIFARMTSYATYRIAETVRVLLLVVLAVTFANVYPVSATMIVLLAILNDGAILAIAYDHVRGTPHPVSWDMRSILTIATVIGVVGVAETFLLFAVARGAFGVEHPQLQTLLYLKLSVSGHLTIFVTRTRGHFWQRPAPSRRLLGAVVGTQVLATLIAGLGLLMTPIGWGWAAAVWAYALVWFLVEDQVKVATRRWLDAHPRRSTSPRSRADTGDLAQQPR